MAIVRVRRRRDAYAANFADSPNAPQMGLFRRTGVSPVAVVRVRRRRGAYAANFADSPNAPQMGLFGSTGVLPVAVVRVRRRRAVYADNFADSPNTPQMGLFGIDHCPGSAVHFDIRYSPALYDFDGPLRARCERL